MDFLVAMWGYGWHFLAYLLPFLFVLTIVVFFHEFGHFIVGRLCGVRVLTFSLGFGPELLGFNDRHGTRWRFAAIPLGGYVKFFGDANAASVPDHERAAMMTAEERKVSFFHKPIWKRAAVVAAGPIANFIVAILIFAAVFAIYGKQTVTPRVDVVLAGSPAEAAGIRAGDLIVEIDGTPIATFPELQRVVGTSGGKPLSVMVERAGSRLVFPVTPQIVTEPTGAAPPRATLGVRGTLQPESPGMALWLGVKETGGIITQTMSFLGRLVAGEENAKEIGGPIKIAAVANQVAQSSGLGGLFTLAALLSVSIGLLNLFPVPLLDGGHLVFYAIEAIRGRPLTEVTQERLFRFGFAVVLMLMLFAMWNDIVHPFTG